MNHNEGVCITVQWCMFIAFVYYDSADVSVDVLAMGGSLGETLEGTWCCCTWCYLCTCGCTCCRICSCYYPLLLQICMLLKHLLLLRHLLLLLLQLLLLYLKLPQQHGMGSGQEYRAYL
jgi:hypothetical protein